MEQQTRAMAFHHEKGFPAQLELARAFAGDDGRIATVEDIVHARLAQSDVHHYVWWNTFVTDSRIYVGKSAAGNPLLIVTHGNAPTPLASGMDTRTFRRLESGHFGDVHIVDLSEYTNYSNGNSASNRFRAEEALKDSVILATLGKEAEAFLTKLDQLQRCWLDGYETDQRDKNVVVINRLYNLYDELWDRTGNIRTGKYRTNVPDGSVHQLTIGGSGFREVKRDSGSVRGASGCDLGVSKDSGIDDLIFTPYFVVGIRGKDPITTVQPCLINLVDAIRRNWPKFVQPVQEVPNDSYLGIKPNGSRERPYYLLSKWCSQPQCTARIMADGTESSVPEYRIKKMSRVKAPPTLTLPMAQNSTRGYPYNGMWKAAVAAIPAGANAISFGSSIHSGRTIEVDVLYWHVVLDDEPFAILMKCGGDFFSQYSDEKSPTSQPYRHVSESTLLQTNRGRRIPDNVWKQQDGGRQSWPLFSHLIASAPENANAMWIEKQTVGWSEKLGRNIQHVTVHYYVVLYDNYAFRPLTVIRADFDWQLDRRKEAKLLVV